MPIYSAWTTMLSRKLLLVFISLCTTLRRPGSNTEVVLLHWSIYLSTYLSMADIPLYSAIGKGGTFIEQCKLDWKHQLTPLKHMLLQQAAVQKPVCISDQVLAAVEKAVCVTWGIQLCYRIILQLNIVSNEGWKYSHREWCSTDNDPSGCGWWTLFQGLHVEVKTTQ